MQLSTNYILKRIYNNHLSFIKNFKSYAKKFQCPTCDRLFDHSGNIKRHLRICSTATKPKYPGGYFQSSKTIFQKLEDFGIVVPQAEQFYPWFITFDMEAMLIKIHEKSSEKLTWTEKHVPISVSVCSNVPEFTSPKCFVNTNLDQLLTDMIGYMYEISNKAEKLAKLKWEGVIQELKELAETWDVGDSGDGEEEHPHNSMKEKIQSLSGQFFQYCNQIPVLSYNGSRYDLNLIKSKLAKHLGLDTAEYTFTVKKNNAYICISNDAFKFLDITQYLAPGSSYAKFLAAFHVDEQKSYFPYQWLDSEDKLDYPQLPPYETFHSDLKRGNVLALELENWNGKGDRPKSGQENYDDLQRIWKDHKMSKFSDFLVYYNNLDTGPMVTAIEKLQRFYIENHIDVFKISISVPGVARKILFDTAKCHFALFDNANQDLYKTVKQNIVGGPEHGLH